MPGAQVKRTVALALLAARASAALPQFDGRWWVRSAHTHPRGEFFDAFQVIVDRRVLRLHFVLIKQVRVTPSCRSALRP